MKSKLYLLTLIGCVAFTPALYSQESPATADTTAPATNTAPAATESAAPATPAATPAAEAPMATVSETGTNAPAMDTVTPTATPAPTTNGIIPLIQFVDVPLTAAIENLARQANLNYILDPKISFGQPGPDGRVVAQPNISIRWENLSAQEALYAVLNNYDLQIVEDTHSKIARIAPKDPTAPDPLVSEVIQLKYASPSNILVAVQSALTDTKRSHILPDVRTSQLVVVATEKELTAVHELVDRLDTPTKQVLIEAKILETTVNPKSVKGIDWSGTLNKQHFTFGNGTTTGTTTKNTSDVTTQTLPNGNTVPVSGPDVTSTATKLETALGNGGLSMNTLSGFSPATAFLNADGLSAALSFLNNSADTKVISEPRSVTLDNQKSLIEVGLMYPIVNTTAGTANTTGGSQISYTNLTVNLDVTPRITANNFVELKVQQSILRLGPQFSSTVGGVINNVDSFFTRKIDTTVLIPSGNTLVMGGLVSDENSSANVKVPILGDLPGIGLAFRKDTKERNRQNLIIFITPTIVQDSDFRPAQTQFLHSTGQESATEGVSPWDSGKPYDWSKPAAENDGNKHVFQPVNP